MSHCNRYEQRGPVSQIRAYIKALKYELTTTPATDNLEPLPNIYPDQDAPVLRPAGKGKIELAMLRWGFPALPTREGDKKKQPITNIRNLESKWWSDVNREWMTKPEYRCLVPFTAFAEPARNSTWFTVRDTEIAFFAGVWRPWEGKRLYKLHADKNRVQHEQSWELYSFLTTDANDLVRPVHPKAMPVILTDPDECIEWLSGGEESFRLQRPYPAERMEIALQPSIDQ
jgi:putative SOS response-associated peptidase YedK